MVSELWNYTLFIDLGNLPGYQSLSNTTQNKEAEQKTKVGEHSYKLINGPFYGKTRENTRKRLNIDVIDKSDTNRKLN